jgi:hypothetical protein
MGRDSRRALAVPQLVELGPQLLQLPGKGHLLVALEEVLQGGPHGPQADSRGRGIEQLLQGLGGLLAEGGQLADHGQQHLLAGRVHPGPEGAVGLAAVGGPLADAGPPGRLGDAHAGGQGRHQGLIGILPARACHGSANLPS